MKQWLLAAALTLVALQPSDASTFIAMSTGDLVRGSSAVVAGEVLTVESYWESTGRVIVTEAMVRVEDVLAGEAPSVVRVKTFGGTVGGFTVEAIGFPTFTRGERLVLFLEPDTEPDMVRVTGYQQGQYRIQTGADGRELAVSAVDGGALLLAPDGRATDRPAIVPLAELRQRIQSEAAEEQRP
jgi:hypothetical protein